jgi:hypothetical protein
MKKVIALKVEDTRVSLEWLLDPVRFRGEGRTNALATAYFNVAMKNPGVWIIPRDHFPQRRADEMLMRKIKELVSRLGDDFHFDFQQQEFRLAYGPIEYVEQPSRKK